MEELGLFEGKEDRVIPLKFSDRSKTPIEPYLSDQWFVKMGDRDDGKPGLAQMAMDAVTDGPGEVLPRALRRTATSTGSARSATGASAGNCGGATAFRCGRSRTGRATSKLETIDDGPKQTACELASVTTSAIDIRGCNWTDDRCAWADAQTAN